MRIIYITGTGTDAGKTVVTTLLLSHLRGSGVNALGMKPFCSGSRFDVDTIQSAQPCMLTDEEVNPFYFSRPLAPLAAARMEKRRVRMEEVLRALKVVARRCDWLLVEGCGGLMVPLGEGFTLADVMGRTGGGVVIAAPNRLGVINHLLLTRKALPGVMGGIAAVLIGQRRADLSSASNPGVLGEILSPIQVFQVPFLDLKPLRRNVLHENCRKIKKVLAALLEQVNFTGVRSLECSRKKVKKRL